MNATAIIAVGNELLAGEITDTNSKHLAGAAFAAGYPVKHIEVIPDDITIIAGTLNRLIADPQFNRLVMSGGIGPTPDDVTLEGVALALGRELSLHPDAFQHIQDRVNALHQAGRLPDNEVSEPNRRMAMMGAGAAVHINPNGMAPLIVYELEDDRFLFVLPGVPREFVNLVDNEMIPRYFTGGAHLYKQEVHYSGIPESKFSDALTQLAQEFPALTFGSYPQEKYRDLIIRVRGSDEAMITAAVSRLHQLEPS